MLARHCLLLADRTVVECSWYSRLCVFVFESVDVMLPSVPGSSTDSAAELSLVPNFAQRRPPARHQSIFRSTYKQRRIFSQLIVDQEPQSHHLSVLIPLFSPHQPLSVWLQTFLSTAAPPARLCTGWSSTGETTVPAF